MKEQIAEQIGPLIKAYAPESPQTTADGLRELWLQFEPKSINVISAEQRAQQETIGTPVIGCPWHRCCGIAMDVKGGWSPVHFWVRWN